MGIDLSIFKSNYLLKNKSIAPLVTFRIVFGALMFCSILRFMINGWVTEQYVLPKVYFPFFGWDWIQPLGAVGMYVLFSIMALSFLFVALGLFYRISIVSAFLVFTYVELIDKTNYLNHYYFISIVCFLMIFQPAHKNFSLDIRLKNTQPTVDVPRWMISAIRLQLGLVYFFAGWAKLNADWLFEALPLKIWLPAKSDLPIIGSFMEEIWVAYFFSWMGALYDLSIPFLLLIKKTRPLAYGMVIVFHLLTWMLFPIGMFPFIMIGSTLIFFPTKWHQKILEKFSKIKGGDFKSTTSPSLAGKLILVVFAIHFAFQLVLPFRHAWYDGNLFWHEQGYRFSWRVMLVEKGGYATFTVKDKSSNRTFEINNYDYLTSNQEKMMSYQPDMIQQFAQYIVKDMQNKGIDKPEVYVNSMVTLNGRPSKMLIDPTVDIAQVKDNIINQKNWIIRYD